MILKEEEETNQSQLVNLMKSKLNKVSVNLFLQDMAEDISNIKYEEKKDGDLIIAKFKIKGFSMSREIWPSESYESSVKRLFEEFLNNSMNHHIRSFWRL